MWGCAHMIAGTHRGQKEAVDPLELELVISSCEYPLIGTGNQSWVLCRSSICPTCSYPLSCLCSSCFVFNKTLPQLFLSILHSQRVWHLFSRSSQCSWFIQCHAWFFTLYFAVKYFSKQNLTIEDSVSHSAHMAISNTDGKLWRWVKSFLMKGLFTKIWLCRGRPTKEGKISSRLEIPLPMYVKGQKGAEWFPKPRKSCSCCRRLPNVMCEL